MCALAKSARRSHELSGGGASFDGCCSPRSRSSPTARSSPPPCGEGPGVGVGRRRSGSDGPCAVADAWCVAARPPTLPSPTRGEGVDARFFSSRPVCEPTPARPRPMPGLSKSASDGSSGAESGRAALARVGFAGSFFECLAGSRYFGGAGRSGRFAMARIWAESGSGESVAVLAFRHTKMAGTAGEMDQ